MNINWWMVASAVLMAAAAAHAYFAQGNPRIAGVFLSYAVANALLAGAK